MREYPMIFNSEMVNAILHGTANTKAKTQTRRKRGIALAHPYLKLDRLWVRESFCLDEFKEDPKAPKYLYKADYAVDADKNQIGVTRWKPAIHMPREASRITLEIMDVRLERLQEISDADAIAEGIVARNYSAKEAYLELWDSMYGKDDHKLNPFVWVIEFKRLEGDK